MAQQAGGSGIGLGALGNQFGDTTYTKVFVGGLAWETQRETMRRHFEQFGDILEAVVITDKNTGRSKGYGFVTFRDAESARKACEDATPIIDGRRANCNLASLGAHRHRPHGQHGNRFRPVSPFSAGPQQGGPGFTGSFPQAGSPYGHAAPQAFYPPYGGYPQYPQDFASYPPNLFQYGGPQYAPQMYGAPGALSSGSGPVYPYGSFTTQPLQGGPVYPGSQYGFQAPHLYGSTGASLTSLPPAYGGSGTVSTSTSPVGVSPVYLVEQLLDRSLHSSTHCQQARSNHILVEAVRSNNRVSLGSKSHCWNIHGERRQGNRSGENRYILFLSAWVYVIRGLTRGILKLASKYCSGVTEGGFGKFSNSFIIPLRFFSRAPLGCINVGSLKNSRMSWLLYSQVRSYNLILRCSFQRSGSLPSPQSIDVYFIRQPLIRRIPTMH